MSLQGHKIILGITGSIAAYKSAFLARLLMREGAEVRVIMTPSASQFISPLTLSTLTGHGVWADLWSEDQWNNHVELALWADFMIFAPVTANSLAKMAHGIVDNLVLATYLSAKCPIYLAPAMDLDMWKHPSTQSNIKTLQSHGCKLIPVGSGPLASGLSGPGRMAEPEEIVDFVSSDRTESTHPLSGLTATVTAGPTREHVDPARFLSNPSSGRMGQEIALQLAQRGCQVHLILGPASYIAPSHPLVTVHPVISAHDMYQEALKHHDQSDIVVFAAAVADYKPSRSSDTKLKKKDGELFIELTRTKDIAKTLGKQKGSKIHVGFALETNDEIQNARRKLASKNFDFIVLNSLQDQGAGFGTKTNKISILRKDNTQTDFELKDKALVARDIIDEIETRFQD